MTDAVAGVKNVSVNVSQINATLNNVTLQANGTGTNRWNYTLIVNGTNLNATYPLPIYAFDNASNFNGTEHLELKVDNAIPDVFANDTDYPEGQTAAKQGDTITINAYVTDAVAGVKNVSVNVSQINATENNVTLNPNGTNRWNYTLIVNKTGLNDTYNLPIYAFDNASNFNGTETLEVRVDNAIPSVISNTNNVWVANGSTVILNATITDPSPGYGVKNATVNVSAINNTINEAILTNQSGYWINDSIIADVGDTGGLVNLTITAYDNVSNCNDTINMTVGIDVTEPIVTAIEPINSYVVNGSTLELNVSVTDTASGVNASAVWVNVSRINNTLGNYTLTRVGTFNYWNGSIIVNTTNEGTQNLTVYAYDNVSNCNSSVNLTAGRDLASPTVTAITIGVWTANNSVVTLNASITDELSGVKNATVNVSAINETINEAILEKQGETDYWTNTSIIADKGDTGGLKNLTITAYDNVSLCNDTINMTVGIDEGTPNVTAVTLNQWYANNTAVALNASITDLRSGVKNATVNVSAINSTINEAILTKQTGDYWTNTTIIADRGDTGGFVNLTITAYDNVSLYNNTINMTVGIDVGSPNVTAITLNQWYANNTEVTLNASVTDPSPGSGVKNATVNVSAINNTINEAILTNQSGYWINDSIIADVGDTGGLKNLTITAYDNVSNCNASINMTVGIDETPPIVTAIEPINSYVVNGSTLELNVSVTDTASGVNASAVRVNVSRINNTLGNYTLTRVGTSNYWNGSIIVNTTNEGTQNLTVYAYDNVSNCNSSVNLTAGRDLASPTVTAITIGVWTANNSVVTLNASITDDLSGVKNATVNVSRINSTINEAILEKQGETNYWTNTSIIADKGDTGGLKNLTITAYDNVSLCNNTINMTLGIDATEPSVTAITLNQWAANNSAVTLNASITDTSSDVKNATVNVSEINSTINEAILIKQDGDYWTNTTIIADRGDTGGLKNLTITAYDNVSNCNNTVNMTLGISEIIINEIMYNPPADIGDDSDYEWVELHNIKATSIDVGGWTLHTNNNASITTILSGTSIEANGYLIIARNDTAFKHYYHWVNESLVITNKTKGSGLELVDQEASNKTTIVLKNSTGAEIDNVTYRSSWGADGDGYTLERDSSWKASNSYSGTPLDKNSIIDSEPVILDYEPHDTNPTNNSGETMTFRVKANQTVNVTWYINGSVVHTNTSVTADTWANYNNESAKAGYWNVTAFVNNTNGSDTMLWMWNVKKVVTINITYPLNGTEIPRGKDVGSKEDSRDIVPDNLTITARIYNYYNTSDPIPANKANCSFYWNGTLLGYNETNSSGYCQFEYDKTNNVTGCYYNITANFTLLDTTNYTSNSTLNENSTKIKLVKYVTSIEKDNYKTGILYKEGDAAILRINTTKDDVFYDPLNITVYVAHESQSQESEDETIQYYPGDITKITTGQYYSKTIITDEKFNISGSWKDIHWYVWVKDNVTINGAKQADVQNVSSTSESDVEVQGSDASLNINVTNETATINNANITIYDANLERRTVKELILLNYNSS